MLILICLLLTRVWSRFIMYKTSSASVILQVLPSAIFNARKECRDNHLTVSPKQLDNGAFGALLADSTGLPALRVPEPYDFQWFLTRSSSLCLASLRMLRKEALMRVERTLCNLKLRDKVLSGVDSALLPFMPGLCLFFCFFPCSFI